MELGIEGKYALVTGGSHGIGRSIALALAREGCHVAVCARDQNKIEAVVAELRAHGGEARGVVADALRKDDIDRAVHTLLEGWGRIDILINNVGGGGRWGSPIVEETADEVWTDVYAKNALASVRFTMGFLPSMQAHQWGRVVTVASKFGREGGGRPWFTMAKSAEISLMKTLGMDPRLARSGITFNSVAPGSIMIPDTGWDQVEKADPAAFEKMVVEKFPLGRLGRPEEVAEVVVFLCSLKASLVNGACIAVDGGESAAF